MKRDRTYMLVLGLLALSVALYALNFAIYHDARDIGFYTLLDLAFIPIEVLVVGGVINRLLAMREKQALLHKLNMVIGAFFNEVGNGLLKRFSGFDGDASAMSESLVFTHAWKDADFASAEERVAGLGHGVDSRIGDLDELKRYVTSKRHFLLGLLENPNLLEHERFTDLLWAVFHVEDELAHRDSLEGLPKADMDHLSVDIRRAYLLLLAEWLEYMRHLKHQYPYLYSLAVRTNPFDPDAQVEVTG